MISTLLTKFWLPLAIVAGFAGGSFFGSKVLDKKCPDLKCPEIPACNCPAAVELNNFDLEKINNKKGGQFHLHNTLSNVTIKIEAKDSVLIKQLLRQAK
jgi:hypothetical protein